MRIFLASAFYSYKGGLAWLTPVMFIAQKLFIPLGQVGFFSLIGAYGGSQPLDFYLVGNSMLVAASASLYLGLLIGEERWLGTLPFFVASPANRLALFSGKAVGHFVEGVIWAVVAFLWAAVAFGLRLPLEDWAPLLLVVLVASASAACFGLLLGGFSYVSVDAGTAYNAFIFTLLIVSGANIPRDELPAWLSAIGEILPMTRSIEASRLLVAGRPWSEVGPLLEVEALIGLAFGLSGYFLFRRFENQARRRGTLEGS